VDTVKVGVLKGVGGRGREEGSGTVAGQGYLMIACSLL